MYFLILVVEVLKQKLTIIILNKGINYSIRSWRMASVNKINF